MIVLLVFALTDCLFCALGEPENNHISDKGPDGAMKQKSRTEVIMPSFLRTVYNEAVGPVPEFWLQIWKVCNN